MLDVGLSHLIAVAREQDLMKPAPGSALFRRSAVPTIILLIISNVFMTTAWYWHLKGGMAKPLIVVILISWGLALVEYCFAVPANRLGYEQGWTGAQLKIVQEAISISVFAIFMVTYLGEPLHWRQAAAFLCIVAAVAFLFVGK
jgi:hypothetical protein